MILLELKKSGIAKHLMTLEKIYWGYGQKPKRLVIVTIIAVIFFGFIYSLSPSSISNLSSDDQSYFLTLLNSLYYSAVTFTTLGYGDLSPTGIMRFFAAIEALFGAITVGFLVAGLARSDS